ncbi:MAG: peptidase S8 [Bacteroidetes bacterium]|nr:MAG: peptidase S8 [Bacteroidota bacterium]
MHNFTFRNLTAIFALLFLATGTVAQEDTGWHLKDPGADNVNGTGVEKLYNTTLKGKESQTVIVAIIDSGVDMYHEDLNENIWINEDEIPDNGIDDDQNGYVDDINGWNFIGGADGRNVTNETLEVTRLYGKYSDYFAEKDTEKLSKKDQKLYDQYLEYKETVEGKRTQSEGALSSVEVNEKVLLDAIDAFDKEYPNKKLTKEFLESFDGGDDEQMRIVQSIFSQISQFGIDIETTAQIREEISAGYAEAKKHYQNDLEYMYNPDFDSRVIVGDNYSDSYEMYYGNNDVQGEFNFHGTHVAGIVGAVRGNDKGVQGIVQNVRLMIIRTVPDGDERDKDVANAIRYAVDNGASVINMSFGKGQSWDKRAVDKAVKHAMKNDVLLVHAAGNEATDNDAFDHYPTPTFEKKGLFSKKYADNWIEVGALAPDPGEGAVASFSNYGGESVDLFAPGVQVNSTAPGSTYRPASGTSMAAPVVAGVAALIRSYYPTLTAKQVKSILTSTTIPVKNKVKQPGTGEIVAMSELCNTGGMISAEKAFKAAAGVKGKKKVKTNAQSTAKA